MDKPNKKKCLNCGYEWQPHKDKPLSCPRCKIRFDYPGNEDKLKTL
jgi:predicted Zn-ribbon and HTH transcriptional regulator